MMQYSPRRWHRDKVLTEPMDDKHYYLDLAEAFARGSLRAPASAAREEVLAQAKAAKLPLHRFKRTSGLPRVARVLGMLREIRPEDVLDVGSGRGAFLWPLRKQSSPAIAGATVPCRKRPPNGC